MAEVRVKQLQSRSILNRLTKTAQLLWRETDLESLRKKFLRILRDDHQINRVNFYCSTDQPARWTPRLVDNFPNSRSTLAENLLQKFASFLPLQELQNYEFNDGLHQVGEKEKRIYFFLTRDFTGGRTLGLIQPPSTQNWHALDFQILDFSIRQLQNATKWFSRLEKTQELLHRDDLTGLFNYRYLDECLDNEIRRTHRFQTSFCLLFIDLDNFKPVNDQFGHLAGSQVLKQMATVLRDGLREVDTIFRYGGDEFVVLLLETNRQTGARAGERILEKIASHHFFVAPQKKISLTASIGVAACPENTATKEELLSLADLCMYKGKRLGKNQVTIMEPGKVEYSA